MKEKEIREAVRERYGSIAQREGSCCSPSSSASSCCGPAQETGSVAESKSGAIGYSAEEMGSIPEGSNMGLGCGNPLAFTSLKEGDTVLDLGSGGASTASWLRKRLERGAG